jgi:hypothetical protein
MEIRNECLNPPLGILRHVRRALRWINPADLAGIAYVQLLDKIDSLSKNAPAWHRQVKEENYSVYGMYVRKHVDNPAYIILYVQDIYRCIHPLYQRTPLATLRLGYMLAHEVGHHLQATRGHIFQPGERLDESEYKEELADRYAFSVIKKMKERWSYRLGQWLMKDSARMFYSFGVQEWKKKNFREAAEYFYKSWELDPEGKEASYWYNRAKALYRVEQNQ